MLPFALCYVVLRASRQLQTPVRPARMRTVLDGPRRCHCPRRLFSAGLRWAGTSARTDDEGPVVELVLALFVLAKSRSAELAIWS